MARTLRSALLALGVAAALMPLVGTSPAAAATLPPGFTDTLVAAVPGATGLTEISGGRMLVLDRSGVVMLVRSNGSTAVALDIPNPVCAGGEQGLLGVAASGATVALYYTVPAANGSCAGGSATNRVSAWTLTGDTLVNERILIDGIPTIGTNHNGGDLHVGADGLLYISVGDGGGGRGGPWAPDTTRLNGKILRIGLDGSIPGDNPFSGAASCSRGRTGANCPEVFSWGLRNPFRMAFDEDAAVAGQTRFRINDVGEGTWEEIDDGVLGANYGWPSREGPCATGSTTNCGPSGLNDPVGWYPHTSGCRSITAGAFVPAGAWPGYDGAYVYADYICDRMFVLRDNNTIEDFSPDSGPVIDMEFVREAGAWSLYYTTFGDGGQLRRITADAPAPPVGPGHFVPVNPTRILDTRIGLGAPAVKPAAGSTTSLTVTGGVVPPDAIVAALNLTVTEPDAAGYATVYPAGSSQPDTSDVNVSEPGEVAANAATVALGASGRVNIYSYSSAHLVADITGYWLPTGTSPASAGRFTPVAPSRLLDTRDTGGLGAGGQADVAVLGRGGVPATGVSAVALTVTYTNVGAPGYVTVWPTGQAQPYVSTTNPNGADDIRSNLATVPVGAGGQVSVATFAPADIVLDVVGWFTDDGAPLSNTGLLVAVPRHRAYDSRRPGPPDRLGGGESTSIDMAAEVDPNASAVLANLTATNTVSGGYLTAYPVLGPPPLASTVNWSGPDQSRAALAVLTRQVGLYAYSDVDWIVDVSGWFTS